AGQGGREPEGPRLLQAPRARGQRAREDAARAAQERGGAERRRVRSSYPDPHSRRGFLRTMGGVVGAALLPRRARARPLFAEVSRPVVFTDVTAAAGLLHATNVSGSPNDKQFI